MDARAFAEAREALAASFAFDTYDDAVVGLRPVPDREPRRGRRASRAGARRAALRRRRDRTGARRRSCRSSASRRARPERPSPRRTFDALAFGDHPYGSVLDGTAESVAALTRDDLVAAHDAALTRDRVYVGRRGRHHGRGAGPAARRAAGRPARRRRPAPGRGAPYLLPGGVTVVPFDTPQSVAYLRPSGHRARRPRLLRGLRRRTRSSAGAGFQSRLMEEVREKRGLTYGIGTFLAELDLSHR